MTDLSIIPGYENWAEVKKISYGWSRDQKYLVTDKSGNKCVLRLSDWSLFESKNEQFNRLKRFSDIQKITHSIDFGYIPDHFVYLIYEYVDGEDANKVIPYMSDQVAYQIGREAGVILSQLHDCSVIFYDSSKDEKYKERMKERICKFRQLNLESNIKDMLIDFFCSNSHLVMNRPQVLTHGDFHIGNMVYNNGIRIIDFDKAKLCDPYDDFKPFCWNVRLKPAFECGIIDGYFDDKVPQEFWLILRVYACENLLGHIIWAKEYGAKEVETAHEVMKEVLEWYDDFKLIIPKWYKTID